MIHDKILAWLTKPALTIDDATYSWQYTLEFPSGSPLLLVEIVADALTSGNTVVVALNGQPFAATTSNLYSRPYVWVPPSTHIDIFAANSGVVAHATGMQLAL